MATLIVQEPPEIEDWLRRRRALGQDRRDEIWKGVYHVAPLEHVRNGLLAAELSALLVPLARDRSLRVSNPTNLGTPEDYRGPDLLVIRADASLQLYMPSAELVVEVLSPGDESWQKLPHYAVHGVGEVWMIDPDARTVRMLALSDGYRDVLTSTLFGLTPDDVEQALSWPAADD